MFLNGLLIEAKDLINGVSIAQAERVDRVDYFHIELDSHDVILAEGAWSETFVDFDSRHVFQNAPEFALLHPEQIEQPMHYFAPRVEDGYELEKVRRLIAERYCSSKKDHPGDLRGSIDRVTERSIEGWAQNVEFPEAPVCLDLLANGELIGQTLADRYREDLHSAGLGTGKHAFTFSMPDGPLPTASIEVRRSMDGASLALAERRAVKTAS
jgi:O-antigen biosynthesis protein